MQYRVPAWILGMLLSSEKKNKSVGDELALH